MGLLFCGTVFFILGAGSILWILFVKKNKHSDSERLVLEAERDALRKQMGESKDTGEIACLVVYIADIEGELENPSLGMGDYISLFFAGVVAVLGGIFVGLHFLIN